MCADTSTKICSFVAAMLLTWDPSNAHENAHENTLKPGEGYILVSTRLSIEIKSLVLARHGSKGRVTVTPRGEDRFYGEDLLLKAKAGHYYFKTVHSYFPNVLSIPQPEPDDMLKTFNVTEGAITYIGHWKFGGEIRGTRHSWPYTVGYPADPMLALLDGHPWVKELPLFVSGVGIKLKQLSWE